MATNTSRWRERSRRVIRETLAKLPGVQNPKAIRLALREACPFGERENYPYKIWCDEVRQALKPFLHHDKPPAFRVRIARDGVYCNWCGNVRCLACAAARDEWQGGAGVFLRRFTDGAPSAILADALEDHDYVVCAKLMRLE